MTFAPATLWGGKAACKDAPTEWFFNRRHKKKAFALCRECPVRQECLNHQLETVTDLNWDSGVWGMTTPWDRHKMRQSRSGRGRDRTDVTR